MTETEKMRAILHERGIEYRDVNSMVTDIEHDGIKTRVYDYDDGPDYQLCVEQKWLTAEEAVRVALGIKPQEVFERRIDELCQENEQMRKTAAMLANARTTLLAENAKLREFAAQMANALGIDSEWCDPEWCDSDCMDEFKCRPTGDYGEIHCPAFARMTELGIEVPE